jgi:hypothetical protein
MRRLRHDRPHRAYRDLEPDGPFYILMVIEGRKHNVKFVWAYVADPKPMAPPCFPRWRNQPANSTSRPHPVDPNINRSTMAPRRTRTREQERRDRINTQRRQRLELNAEQQRQHQAWLAAHYKPPPF